MLRVANDDDDETAAAATRPALLVAAENPVADRVTGIAQGTLRLAYRSKNKRAALVRAFQQMRRSYPGSTFYVTLTANVVLRHQTEGTFQVFYGQSYGRAKSVYLGQVVDEDGELEQLFQEFPVSSESDAAALPTDWAVSDFQELFKRNFANSNVAVHEIISLVYFFSKGLEHYERQKTLPARPAIVPLFDN